MSTGHPIFFKEKSPLFISFTSIFEVLYLFIFGRIRSYLVILRSSFSDRKSLERQELDGTSDIGGNRELKGTMKRGLDNKEARDNEYKDTTGVSRTD